MFTRRSWPFRGTAPAHAPLAQDQSAALDAEASPGGAALPRTMSRPARTNAVQRARRRRRVARWLIAGVVLLAVTAVLVVEARTSRLQAKLFASFDSGIRIEVGPGPNPAISFPDNRPL